MARAPHDGGAGTLSMRVPSCNMAGYLGPSGKFDKATNSRSRSLFRLLPRPCPASRALRASPTARNNVAVVSCSSNVVRSGKLT
ncbi:hypothetical protein VTN02DRAFT_3675 [Thermoascus thermophilus]